MILVTGGAGYIGSHTCVELIKGGHQTVIVDNFSNSSPDVVKRINQITGKETVCVQADVRDEQQLSQIFKQYPIEAAIHFAGSKAVGESVAKPLQYYRNNIEGMLTLCSVMAQNNVKKLIFSSSATVYHKDNNLPLCETDRLGSTNPYGRTKQMIESILQDLCTADQQWSIVALRYFNPVGAHESGQIGDSPNDTPNNLMPYVTRVAAGKLKELRVFGDDYPTIDGTGVRDYIHVVDLARGHISALHYAAQHTGMEAINLGTGRGYSVLEVLNAFYRATRIKIPYRIVERRPGDIAECYACTDKAKEKLGWQATQSLEQMCADAWRFERN